MPDQESDLKIEEVGLKHGDVIYLHSIDNEADTDRKPAENIQIKQDKIDDYLESKDGLIYRKIDSKFCKHGDKGMCDYCMPLEPYDPSYLEEQKIKHLSFHSFLKKLKSSGSLSLEEPDYTVRPCPGHPPFPYGLCTKCQPSAIILQRQEFRMVDHIEFENAAIVDEFIGYWRKTGYQRFGLMYGKYEPYEGVPLGMKAVVCCIYEPKQDCSVDGFELLPDPNQDAVDSIADRLGLVKVGMIYTDLQQLEDGKIASKRNASSYFISSLESVFIAQMQISHPSLCKYSKSGYFGSKFVTVVITGDESGKAGLIEFQVSNAAMAMVRSDIIEPSVDPSLMRIKQSSAMQYIPELFYKYTNSYNVPVQVAADPTFPVDYLLVRLTHGYAPNATNLDSFFHQTFPSINREEIEPVKLVALSDYFHQFVDPHYLLFCNFQMLIFLSSLQIFSKDDFICLLEAVRTKDVSLFVALEQTASWLTLQSILADESSSSINSTEKKIKIIKCGHCTFLNTSSNDNCEMCGLPLNS